MRTRILVLVLFVLLCGAYVQRVNANHIAAVNITYVGIDTAGIDTFSYVITIRIYRDCSNLNPAPGFITINYESGSCGLAGSDTINYSGSGSSPPIGAGTFMQLPCLGVDTCDPALSAYGVEEYIYSSIITLPDACDDWLISYETGGLRNANDVLLNATSQKIYVEALINNVDAPSNNSPSFIKPPLAVFCVNRDFFFNQGAIESDGDSLVYSLVQAQGAGGAILPYDTSYTAQYPFNAVDSPLTMEPSSGVISFTPDTPAVVSVMSVLIQEYNSDGVLIGSIKNDMQVLINDSCTSDTLNFVGDTTTPTGVHPTISAQCLDLSITIHFDNPIQCETISLDGSDLVIIAPNGDTVDINLIVPPICSAGLVDSLVIILADSMRFNGTYLILDVIGSDFIPLLSECGLRLNDTLEVRLRNCVKATVDLLNVTVVNNSSIDIIWSKYTENFQDAYFYRYDVYRSLNPGTGYDSIGTILDITDTTFSDFAVTLVDTPYNYLVKMILDPALQLAPLSDTIQSIHLNGIQNQVDTGVIDLLWTDYWGWDAAIYELLESIDLGPWELVDVLPDPITTYAYNKSLLANSYRLMMRSIEPTSEMVTESNWVEFVIPVKIVPNIITPNGDGVNDFFLVNEQLLYAPVHLVVFNRWGGKVFEDTDYENKWDGDNFGGNPLSNGTYYYLLKFNGVDDRAGFITILR